MRQTIWKYQLSIEDSNIFLMPKFSRILCVKTQAFVPCIWALVNPDEEMQENREIVIQGTGHVHAIEFPGELIYIGTFLTLDDTFVGHVFERRLPQ